jgi:hypothetical protein
MTALAERQRQIEASQDKARAAWRALDARVHSLEEKVGGTLSSQQRGYLYHVGHEEQLEVGEARRACFAALKARYRVAKYDQIPATMYTDAADYVQREYSRLTGGELGLPEESSLDLG